MKIRVLSDDDFILNKYSLKPDLLNIPYSNFHYFKFDDIYDSVNNKNPLYDDQTFFIMAYDDDDNIIGVLKYTNYDNEYIGINYVDIHKQYKHSGIGTKLVKYFNDLDLKLDVYCSCFSDECYKTNFHKKMFTILTDHTICWDHRGYTFKDDDKFYDIDKKTVIDNPFLK